MKPNNNSAKRVSQAILSIVHHDISETLAYSLNPGLVLANSGFFI
jgi:hypothetical protein